MIKSLFAARQQTPMRRWFAATAAAVIATVLAALAALAVSAPAAAAPAASTPGWRVAAVFGPRTGVTSLGGLVATSKTDAWSTWRCSASCGASHPSRFDFVEHWSGRGWHTVPLPSKLASYAGGFLAASSGKDAWLFKGAGSRHALRWNGSRWALTAIPSWVVQNGGASGIVRAVTADFSRSDLWVFGSSSAKTPFAAHFRNGRWSKVILPAFFSEVSAVAPDDIWATGYQPSGGAANPVLMHWNGRSWHTMAIPAPTNVPPHATEYASDPLALGPANVWLQRNILVGLKGAHTLYLMHWNGSRWARVYFRYRTSFADFMASDGHGGIWIVANGPAPGYRWYFYHLNAGHWSRQLAPATATTTFQQVTAIRWIPGTRSLWAAGGLLPLRSTTAVLGALLRYRP